MADRWPARRHRPLDDRSYSTSPLPRLVPRSASSGGAERLVETGEILKQPKASFHDSAQLSETSGGSLGTIGNIIPLARVLPGQQQTQSGDSAAASKELADRGITAVANDLTGQVAETVGVSKSAAKELVTVPRGESVLVAGISDGAVYINKGANSGIKAGDRFQISHNEELPLVDPATQKHLTSKKNICILMTQTINESNASGSCSGGIPRAGDIAEPIPH